ncbi:MAG TPA: ATP-binding protein, partial [Opitutales bacterium]|nr:ATP-binding protein [Opitutales bacterium]
MLPLLMRGCVHDFNNMLTVVLGSLALVEQNIDSAPMLKHCLNRANSAAIQAKALSEHLLKMTHATMDDPLCSDVHVIARKVSQVFVDGRLHHLDLHLPNDLHSVAMAPIELFQVIGNLVLNAVEAMPKGGMIALEGSNKAQQVILTISDTGPGLSGEVLDQLLRSYVTTKPHG